MDLMYINHASFSEDFKLIFATIRILFVRESTEGVAKGTDHGKCGRDGEKCAKQYIVFAKAVEHYNVADYSGRPKWSFMCIGKRQWRVVEVGHVDER